MLKVEEEEEDEEQEVEYTESWGEREIGGGGGGFRAWGWKRGTHHGSHQRMRDKSEGEHSDVFNMDGPHPVDGHTPHSTGWDLPASRKLD